MYLLRCFSDTQAPGFSPSMGLLMSLLKTTNWSWQVLFLLFTPAPFINSAVLADEPAPAVDGTEQRSLLKAISDAEQQIEQQNWLAAVESFDAAWSMAVDGADTVLDQRGADVRQLAPGQTDLEAGGRARLEQLYRDSPQAFRQELSAQLEDVSRGRISAAVASGKQQQIRTAVTRYQFSTAAERGLRVLCRIHLDRGDFIEAALSLEQLRRRQREAPAELLASIAWCYQQGGLADDAEDLLRLAAAAGSGAADDPAKLLISETSQQQLQGAEQEATAAAWLQPYGGYRRNRLHVTPPLAQRTSWTSSLFEVADILYAEEMNPLLAECQSAIRNTYGRLQRINYTAVPVAQPLSDGKRIYVRTAAGLRALDAATGNLIWEVSQPEQTLRMLLDPESDVRLTPETLSSELLDRMLRLNTASQMSISGDTLFAVEDTESARIRNFSMMMGADPSSAASSNFIRAYDAESGLFLWEIGGQNRDPDPLRQMAPNLLAGMNFLGAPLVLGDRMYVLAENNDGILLLRIGKPQPEAGLPNPQVLASQLLTIPDRSVTEHPLRGLSGLIPSFAQGLLICPLCDDRIVAVSAEDLSIRWIFRYRGILKQQEIGGNAMVLPGSFDAQQSRQVDFESRWADFLPRIAGDRVFVTPRDSDQLYCLDLQTGRQLWNAARASSHAISGISTDHVLLSGNRELRALAVTTGELLWTALLRQGTVCGTAAFDGRVLYVPLNTPAILALDSETGQELVRQDWVTADPPGNLLITSAGLVSQSVFAVTGVTSGAGEATIVEQATVQLLQGELEVAAELLREHLQQNQSDAAARSLLIDVLLRTLRQQGDTDGELQQRVEALLQRAAEDVEVAPLLHSLLGMLPHDAVSLNRLLQGNTIRQREELAELRARLDTAQTGASFAEAVAQVERLLEQIPLGLRRANRSAGVLRRQSDVLARVIRGNVQQRSSAEQVRLQKAVVGAAAALLAELSDASDRENFLSTLIRSGLPLTVAALLRDETLPQDRSAVSALHEQSLLSVTEQSDVEAVVSIQRLLEQWADEGDSRVAATLTAELRHAAPGAVFGREPLDGDLPEQISAVLDEFEASQPVVVNWPGVPQVSVSDDRSVQEIPAETSGFPARPIPLYGRPGLYRGVSLAWLTRDEGIAAYDQHGKMLWTMELRISRDLGRGGFRSESWGFSVGRLLVLHLRGEIVVLDGTRRIADGHPPVLWRQKLADERAIEADAIFTPLQDRIERFSNTPAGHNRMGPPGVFGVPVISNQRLTMLDLFNGERVWELDGLAADSRILVDGETLLLLSETSRRIELRSLCDGELLSTSPLPAWWGEAVANQGSSVQDIEPEPGENIPWQIITEGRLSVLFRLQGETATLEARNLLTDEVLWSQQFSRNTVVSNTVEDTLAVLTEGRQLQLLRVDTGDVLAEHSLPQMPSPRMLHLQASDGRWIVLPEAYSEDDPGLEDFYPLTDAAHVHGVICAVNQQTAELDWKLSVEHRQVRLLACNQTRPLLPNLPLLVLLSRGRVPGSEGFAVVVGAQVLDVRTGAVVYDTPDLGRTQNGLGLRPDGDQRAIVLSSDRRDVTFSYGEAGAEDAPQNR